VIRWLAGRLRWPSPARRFARSGAGVACLRGGQLLCVRRRDNGCWDLPGGGLEPGESPEQAARRELTEETGLRAGPLGLLGVFRGPDLTFRYPDGTVVDWTTHLYLCRDVSGEARAGDDAAEVGWFAPDRVPGVLGPATRQYLAALAAHQDGRQGAADG
jgi:8-oxo-dGTP diphosphatase